MTTKAWNRGQLLWNGFVLGTLILPALMSWVRLMETCTDWRDPVSVIGFLGCSAWSVWMAGDLLWKIVRAGVDKADEKG